MGSESNIRLVFIKRSAKTVKGGRRFSFSALVAVGDNSGRVGLGLGKSAEVASAVLKAQQCAAAQMVRVCLNAGTIPHEVCGAYCGARVWLRPAPPGTGLIANKTVRAVLECAGIKNVVSKSLGTHNPSNVAKATIRALLSLRLAEQVYQSRGLKTPKGKALVILKFPGVGAGDSPFDWN